MGFENAVVKDCIGEVCDDAVGLEEEVLGFWLIDVGLVDIDWLGRDCLGAHGAEDVEVDDRCAEDWEFGVD